LAQFRSNRTSRDNIPDLDRYLFWDLQASEFQRKDDYLCVGANVILLMCDLEQRSSFDTMMSWYEIIQSKLQTTTFTGIPFIFLVNKTLSCKEMQLDVSDVSKWVRSLGDDHYYLEIDVMYRHNIDLLINSLTSLCNGRSPDELLHPPLPVKSAKKE